MMNEKREKRKEQGAKNKEQREIKNKQRILFSFFLFSFVCVSAFAQADNSQRESVRLSPDEAVDRALKNNLSLETARVTTGTKKRASDLSWNQFIPSVTASGTMVLNTEKSTISGIAPVKQMPLNPFIDNMLPDGYKLPPGTPNMYAVVPYSMDGPGWTFALSMQASFTLSIAMFENMNRLRLDYEGGLIAYEKAKLQLERDVRKAYNSMLLLQENITLLRGSYENVQRQVQIAQANYRAGLVPELTLLQAQVGLENMKPMMDQVENGMRLSMASFAMSLGMPYDTPFELLPMEQETEFIPLDVKEMISKAASGKPDIQELRHTIIMMQSARKAQFHSLLPFLNLSWNPTAAYVPDPIKDWQNSSGSFNITLGVQLHSLIPWSANFQGIKNFDDQIVTANMGLEMMIQGTGIEIYNTVLSLDKTRITAEAQAQAVNLAERAYQLAERAYRAGLQDHFQVQNAEQALRQARVNLLTEQFNYLNGLLDLEYAIGVPFGTLSKKEK
ncbi:MAG: TolC family protein [Treponema sp.]|nr:TolC family protein [Treponema sp.]